MVKGKKQQKRKPSMLVASLKNCLHLNTIKNYLIGMSCYLHIIGYYAYISDIF